MPGPKALQLFCFLGGHRRSSGSVAFAALASAEAKGRMSTSSSDESPGEPSAAAENTVGVEPLACVSCRSRKLKCETALTSPPLPPRSRDVGR